MSTKIAVSRAELFIATLFSSLVALVMGSALGNNFSFGMSLLYGGLGALVLAIVFTAVLWLIGSRGSPSSKGIPLSYMFVYALVIAMIGVASGGVVGQYEGLGMSILISVLIAMGMGVLSVGFYQLAGKDTKPATTYRSV